MELLDKKLRNRNFSPGSSPRMISLKSAKKSREDFKKSASTSNICDFDDSQSNIVAQLKLQTVKRKLVRNGPITINSKEKQIFLFNDTCLILSENGTKFIDTIPLKDSFVHSTQISLADNIQKFIITTSPSIIIIIIKRFYIH